MVILLLNCIYSKCTECCRTLCQTNKQIHLVHIPCSDHVVKAGPAQNENKQIVAVTLKYIMIYHYKNWKLKSYTCVKDDHMEEHELQF